MKTHTLALLLLFLYSAPALCAPPQVIKTVPQTGSKNVDPALTEIRVYFDSTMLQGSWSWANGGENKFPKVINIPYYSTDQTVAVLPVALLPNKEYVIWINSTNHKRFRNIDGIASQPYRLSFTTGSRTTGI